MEWINCDEKLPRKGYLVLVGSFGWARSPNIWFVGRRTGEGNKAMFTEDKWFAYDKPRRALGTHWMHLPKQPTRKRKIG